MRFGARRLQIMPEHQYVARLIQFCLPLLAIFRVITQAFVLSREYLERDLPAHGRARENVPKLQDVGI
jgi:hypothetical protein